MNANSVAVIGFSTQERNVLKGVFELTSRRPPSFAQFDPDSGNAPDLFLVDASNEDFVNEALSVIVTRSVPVVLVGESSYGTPYPLMKRPIKWVKLLKLLESSVSAQPGADARKVDSVLVVDDSLPVRKFMEAQLMPFGFDVTFAASGEEAVQFSTQKHHTCVFLDVMLPGMDGYQVCKSIKRKKHEGKPTAVVMLTGKTSPFDKIRATMAGCDAYLTKPVDEEKLLEVISKFIPTRGHADAPQSS
jgi:twitching motility two-component system response regulator PilG